MDWCPPLQPQQFPLFWEGLLQDFGMCLLEFLPIHPEAHEVRAFCGSVKFFHTKHIQPMPLWTMLCALVLKQKGPSSNCSRKAGNMQLSKMSQWAEGFRFPFIPFKDFPAQCSQAGNILVNSDLSIILCKQRGVFDHSTEDISTALESSGGSSQCLALCLACMQLLAHGKPYHEAPGPQFFPNVNARGGLEVYNYC